MNSIEELVQWIYSEKNPLEVADIRVMTIDNPGWGVTISLSCQLPNKKLPLADVTNSVNDWYHCTIQDNKFEGDGGLFNLEDIFHAFKVNFDNHQSCYDRSQKMRLNDNLSWLSQWFASQCDGDWEHGNGVTIGTIDNPGWYLKISICETELEKKDFQIVDINPMAHDWVYCEIKDTSFQGFGGPFNLPEILLIFRNWVES